MGDQSGAHGALTRDEVADALQAAWDDFVGDTGCWPDCFTMEGFGHRKVMTADFAVSNFAQMVADWLNAKYDKPVSTDADQVGAKTRRAQWQPCPDDPRHLAEWNPYDRDFPDGWFVYCRECGREGWRRATFDSDGGD